MGLIAGPTHDRHCHKRHHSRLLRSLAYLQPSMSALPFDSKSNVNLGSLHRNLTQTFVNIFRQPSTPAAFLFIYAPFTIKSRSATQTAINVGHISRKALVFVIVGKATTSSQTAKPASPTQYSCEPHRQSFTRLILYSSLPTLPQFFVEQLQVLR